MKNTTIYWSDAMAAMTMQVEVRVRKTWRIRLALWLMKISTKVAGCRFEVQGPPKEANP